VATSYQYQYLYLLLRSIRKLSKTDLNLEASLLNLKTSWEIKLWQSK